MGCEDLVRAEEQARQKWALESLEMQHRQLRSEHQKLKRSLGPPEPKTSGWQSCLGCGCLIAILVFVALLAIAAANGGYNGSNGIPVPVTSPSAQISPSVSP